MHLQALTDHYQDNPYRLWKGFRVFGGDGSTLQLPNQGNIPACFGEQFKHTSLARVFQYTELTSDIVVSTAMLPYSCSENGMAKMQLPDLVTRMRSWGQSKQLYVYDRGFPSHAFAYRHVELGVDFLFRLPKNFHPDIKNTVSANEEADFDFEIHQGKLRHTCRVVIRYLSSGQPLILLTSLNDRSAYSVADLVEVYQLRWRCEESYKFQKLTLELENFASRTVHGVYQEFWATVLLSTLMCLLFNEEEDQLDSPTERINRTVVFGTLKQRLMMTLMGDMPWEDFHVKFRRLCQRHRIPHRPNRSYPRLSFDTRKTRHIYRRCM